MNTLRSIKLFLTSISLLMVIGNMQAKEQSININYNVFSTELLSKDADVDKNVINVKASYSPVAEQVIVSFKLAKQSVVSIKLMDALGNEVLNFSNSSLESGNHNLSFETEGKVSAGFYFVRVMSGVETVVKRISIR